MTSAGQPETLAKTPPDGQGIDDSAAADSLGVDAKGKKGSDARQNGQNKEKNGKRVEGQGEKEGEAVDGEKPPGLLARVAARLGLDVPTAVMMVKGSLPPIIGIAIYQSDVVADYYTTLGYLIAIVTNLAVVVLPRAKFWQNLVLQLLCLCMGAALTMLALWSSIQARDHTSPPTATAAYTYNSSQSAVLGVWLFFFIYAANVLRAKLPVFNLPMITFSIMANIGVTYGVFVTSPQGAETLVKRILVAMLTGLGIAVAVNTLVVPVSCRTIVFKQYAAAVGLLRKLVTLQRAYLTALESEDMFAAATRLPESGGKGHAASKNTAGAGNNQPQQTREAKAAMALAQTTGALRALLGQLQGNMPFAKREVAYGKLTADDVCTMFRLFRNLFVPTVGINSITDILRSVSTRRGWDRVDDDMPAEAALEKQLEKRVWNDVMRQMHEPFAILSEALNEGLLHACICLEVVPRPAVDADIEARGDQVFPGDPGYTKVVEAKVAAFHARKTELLLAWAAQRARADEEEEQIQAGSKTVGGGGDDDGDDGSSNPDAFERGIERRERDQAQLYVILYLENLMQAAGEAVVALAAFGDLKVDDGTMARSRLIVPSARRLRKWARQVFGGGGGGDGSSSGSGAAVDGEQAPDLAELGGGGGIVWAGDGFNRKKDPERLPPQTAWQRLGERVRGISLFLASEESTFGFRAACATMTIGVVAFLESTQVFFMDNRLVWALIMVGISMTLTSGQSVFSFLCKLGGTVVAMISSYIIWYIVDQKTAGVIVFLWFFLFLDFYVFLRHPRFIQAVMITAVTQILVIGYELQVVKIGKAAALSTGQPVYPTYELAPYRLATVAGGCVVAFIWTILPYPLSDRTWLRRDLSATLYLLSNYLSVINSALHGLSEKSVDPSTHMVPGTPAYRLLKLRLKIFGRATVLLSSMAQHTEWQRWEPTISGRFPRALYEEISQRATRIMTFLTLMSFTLTRPPPPSDGKKAGQREVEDKQTVETSQTDGHDDADAVTTQPNPAWDAALAEVVKVLEPAHHTILAALTMLSNALISGQSLPPFIPVPRGRDLSQAVREAGLRGLRRVNMTQEQHQQQDTDTKDGNNDDDDNEGPPYMPTLLEVRRGAIIDQRTSSKSKSRSRGRGGGSDHRRRGDIDTLDAGELERAGISGFATMSVCIGLVSEDLEHLVHAVAELVGVVDYSFQVGGGTKSGSGSSTDVAQE